MYPERKALYQTCGGLLDLLERLFFAPASRCQPSNENVPKRLVLLTHDIQRENSIRDVSERKQREELVHLPPVVNPDLLSVEEVSRGCSQTVPLLPKFENLTAQELLDPLQSRTKPKNWRQGKLDADADALRFLLPQMRAEVVFIHLQRHPNIGLASKERIQGPKDVRLA